MVSESRRENSGGFFMVPAPILFTVIYGERHPTVIGIMADSHGQPDSIVSALALFDSRGCQRIYHLGDVCDSAHPETAVTCLRPLIQHRVITLRGNNDHALVAGHRQRDNSSLPPQVIDTLQNLCLVAEYKNAIFAHSLPFARELGLSCMIRDMGTVEIHRFFGMFPHQVLFRGHSHAPQVTWRLNQHLESRTLQVGRHFDLTGKIPAVITCGALTRGFCMIWQPDENCIELLTLD